MKNLLIEQVVAQRFNRIRKAPQGQRLLVPCALGEKMDKLKLKNRMVLRNFIVPLLFLICVVAMALPAYAAAEEETVRVGVYELEGFHSFEADGSCVGYDVDYLTRIANVTGWNYEYVKADSWAHAMDMLRNGEIDLLSPSQMTTERLEEFRFSTFPIGKVYAAILTRKDNPTVYEDFEAFSQMTFGIETGNTYTGIFETYAAEKGFVPKIQFYDNHKLLVQALRDGEVDAIVANVMRAEPDMRLLGKAGTAQFYYMYRKGDTALGNVLNDALDQIEIDEPNFQSELVSAYFPIYNDEPFSRSELDYVKQLPVIRVACPSGAFPHSYIDSKSGELVGITIDYLTATGNAVGIRYEFVPCMLDQITAEFMQENQINLIVESGLSPIEKNRSKGVYSNNILNTQQLIVCSPDVEFSVDNDLTIAWYGINNIGSKNMQTSFPHFTWKSYSSMTECLEAVKRGEADGCMLNQFAANWYLAKPRYEDFVMMSNSSVAQSICLCSGIENGNFDPRDPTFIKILNKSFKQISNIEEQQITIKYTTAMPYRLTAGEILYKYRLGILLLVALMGMVVVALVVYAHNKNFKAQRDQMTGLYNRTSALRMISRKIATKQSKAGVLILLDLDHFKSVNDTLGHQAGDALLIEAAEVLKKSCRSGDIVCRLGGDEFMLYLPCDNPKEFLHTKLEQIRSSLDRDVTENEATVHVSSSMGVALVPKDGAVLNELYKHADEALYKTKEKGRNGYSFYSEL